MASANAVTINAWADDKVVSCEPEALRDLVTSLKQSLNDVSGKLERPRGDAFDPASREVGWGLILRDDPDFDDDRLVAAADSTGQLQALRAARGGGPVFRYRATKQDRFDVLGVAGERDPVSIADAPVGMGREKLRSIC
jgi:hypothetical protein